MQLLFALFHHYLHLNVFFEMSIMIENQMKTQASILVSNKKMNPEMGKSASWFKLTAFLG